MHQQSQSLSILGFVPALVVQYLNQFKSKKARQLPEKQSIHSVVMFADISGFTALTETLSKMGHEGAEVIAFAINRYMELLVKGIGRSGGDIFKFAGDAMIVIWPPPLLDDQKEMDIALQRLCKQAIQSALDLQAKLNDTNIISNIKLSVKIGFGIGQMNIIHVGGVFSRTEYLATGDPLIQAFHSEHCATGGGQTIVSQDVLDRVREIFDYKEVEAHRGFYFVTSLRDPKNKVKMTADALKMNNNLNQGNFNLIRNEILAYIPAALVPYIEIDEERWSSELRRLTIMFVNLGIDLSDAKTTEGLQQIQQVIQTVQKCVYMHEGSLNKLLMDDKGSTLIVVFGLPPTAHQDDPIRAILTAFLMTKELKKINCSCSVGIATGTVFAGVVGTSGSRREYSVIGDSVNLSARLMSTACSESSENYKIIINEDAARGAEHKISTQFYKLVKLKGKQFETPIYVPLNLTDEELRESNYLNYFPSLRTHTNNVPPSMTFRNLVGEIQTFDERELRATQLAMYGREEILRRITSIIDKFMKGIEKRSLVIVKGTFAIGKTLLARKVLYRIQEKINLNQYSLWKYGEPGAILTSSLGPISKGFKLNGLRPIIQQIFQLYAKRLEREANDELFREIVQPTEETELYYDVMREILALKEINFIDNFPPKPEDDKRAEYQAIKQMTFQLLSYYFEDIPSKYSHLYQKQQEFKDNISEKSKQKTSVNFGNIICPILLCFDDMQNYDEYCFKLIKSILKSYDHILAFCLIRDEYVEQSSFKTDKKTARTQDDIVLEGLATIEGAVDLNCIHSLSLKGLPRMDKEDEFQKLLRWKFNISSYKSDQPKPVTLTPGARKMTILDVSKQDYKNLQYNNHFIYDKNKKYLFENDIVLLFGQYIYLKTRGNPSTAINLFQNLISGGYLKFHDNNCMIGQEMRRLLDDEEDILIDIPSDRVCVNGPTIDRLSCLEQLLLKTASVIGDIFDIQTLNKINPFKLAIGKKLKDMLDELVNKDILEIMEVAEFNIYYRFSHPFLRESFYQRMIFSQRRNIHKLVAEAIQVLPQIFEIEEIRESKNLQFQWRMSEQRWLISSDPQEIKPSDNFAAQKKEPVANQNEESRDGVSSKAIRSIILKQIKNKLARSNNDLSTILKEGLLEKKSDSNITWADRYCVLDGKEIRYYYTEKDAIKKENMLSLVPLRYIHNILPLNEREKYNKNYAFQLGVTTWIKKNKEMPDRTFYFAASDDDSLEQWIIYLEFARAKAIYDDFVNNYGKISFPIGSQMDYYDPQFRFDIYMKKKVNYVQKQEVNTSTSYAASRASRASKFTLASKQIKMMNSTQILDFSTQLAITQGNDFKYLKDQLQMFLEKSMLICFTHIFDMAIQKQDDYKTIGQTNLAIRKFPAIFKVDKLMLPDKYSAGSQDFSKKPASPSNQDLIFRRSHTNEANQSVEIQAKQKFLEEIEEDDDENEIKEEIQTLKISNDFRRSAMKKNTANFATVIDDSPSQETSKMKSSVEKIVKVAEKIAIPPRIYGLQNQIPKTETIQISKKDDINEKLKISLNFAQPEVEPAKELMKMSFKMQKKEEDDLKGEQILNLSSIHSETSLGQNQKGSKQSLANPLEQEQSVLSGSSLNVKRVGSNQRMNSQQLGQLQGEEEEQKVPGGDLFLFDSGKHQLKQPSKKPIFGGANESNYFRKVQMGKLESPKDESQNAQRQFEDQFLKTEINNSLSYGSIQQSQMILSQQQSEWQQQQIPSSQQQQMLHQNLEYQSQQIQQQRQQYQQYQYPANQQILHGVNIQNKSSSISESQLQPQKQILPAQKEKQFAISEITSSYIKPENKKNSISMQEEGSINWGKLNYNINLLLSGLNEKLVDPKLDPSFNANTANDLSQYPRILEPELTRSQLSQLSFPKEYVTQQNTRSQVRPEQFIETPQIKQSRSQIFNRNVTPTKPKLEKTFLNQQAQQDQYGTVMFNCTTVAGEIFQLTKGQKIIIYQIDRAKQLAECSYKGFVGWVEMKNIATLPKGSNKVEPLHQQQPQSVYTQLVHEKFNFANSQKINFTRSITPNQKSRNKF